MATREVPEELRDVYDEQVHEYIGVLIRRLDAIEPGQTYFILCDRIERLLVLDGGTPEPDGDDAHDLTPDEVKRCAALVRGAGDDAAAPKGRRASRVWATRRPGPSRMCPNCGAGKTSKKHAAECGGTPAPAAQPCPDCGQRPGAHVHRVKCLGANDGRHHWSLGAPADGVVRGTCECGAERDFPSKESSKW